MRIEDCYRAHVIKNFKQIFDLVNDQLKHYSCCLLFLLFVFLALQPIVVVFSQPGSGL